MGIRASREHYLKFLVYSAYVFTLHDVNMKTELKVSNIVCFLDQYTPCISY